MATTRRARRIGGPIAIGLLVLGTWLAGIARASEEPRGSPTPADPAGTIVTGLTTRTGGAVAGTPAGEPVETPTRTPAAGASSSKLRWMIPTFVALFIYGLGQGFVKMYSDDVPPATYCLYFFFAKSVVYLAYFVTQYRIGECSALSEVTVPQVLMGILAYILEGIGWICYYESIVAGPISIVGTLSAAYAAPTTLFAFLLLGETLAGSQYASVTLVILGCAGLAYTPPDPDAKVTSRRWIPLAFTALTMWGLWQTAVKYDTYVLGAKAGDMALYTIVGAFLTMGLYGLRHGRGGKAGRPDWFKSVVPMAMMAGGDAAVLDATAVPEASVSLVTAISGAYPVVTFVFAMTVLKETLDRRQLLCVALILVGMYFSIDWSS